MDKTDLKRMWLHFLVDSGKSETAIAKDVGKVQQNLNRTINNGTIKFLEFVNILEAYGYTIEIKKKSE